MCCCWNFFCLTTGPSGPSGRLPSPVPRASHPASKMDGDEFHLRKMCFYSPTVLNGKYAFVMPVDLRPPPGGRRPGTPGRRPFRSALKVEALGTGDPRTFYSPRILMGPGPCLGPIQDEKENIISKG